RAGQHQQRRVDIAHGSELLRIELPHRCLGEFRKKVRQLLARRGIGTTRLWGGKSWQRHMRSSNSSSPGSTGGSSTTDKESCNLTLSVIPRLDRGIQYHGVQGTPRTMPASRLYRLLPGMSLAGGKPGEDVLRVGSRSPCSLSEQGPVLPTHSPQPPAAPHCKSAHPHPPRSRGTPHTAPAAGRPRRSPAARRP